MKTLQLSDNTYNQILRCDKTLKKINQKLNRNYPSYDWYIRRERIEKIKGNLLLRCVY